MQPGDTKYRRALGIRAPGRRSSDIFQAQMTVCGPQRLKRSAQKSGFAAAAREAFGSSMLKGEAEEDQAEGLSRERTKQLWGHISYPRRA